MTPEALAGVSIGCLLGPLCVFGVVTWYLLRELTNVVRAAFDLHMRTQVAMHAELCRMNDRFTPKNAQDPEPYAEAERARTALRGGKS